MTNPRFFLILSAIYLAPQMHAEAGVAISLIYLASAAFFIWLERK